MLNFNPERTVTVLSPGTALGMVPGTVESATVPNSATPVPTTGVPESETPKYGSYPGPPEPVRGKSGSSLLRLDDSALRSNQRSIVSHFDDSYYIWRLCPGDFVEDTNLPGAIFGSTANSQAACIRFADAANQGVIFTRRIPKLWVTGRFQIEVDYTANGASTANFSVTTVLLAATKTGSLNTPTTLYSATSSWPGPAATFDAKQFSAFSTTSLPGNAHVLTVKIARAAVDANANRLDVVAVTLTFIPAKQEVHVP